MAENKKSFVLYTDMINTVKKLPKETQANLLMVILEYVNDLDPVIENDILLEVAFEPIRLQLKRDLKDWENERQKRSEAGKAGGIKSGESRRNEAKRSSASNNEANEAVTVTVNVTDTVIEKEKITFFKIEECLQISLRDPRWVKANNTSELELKAFNKVLEKRGIYETNPAEYKSHFANWKPKGKNEIQIEQPSAPVKHISEIVDKYNNYDKTLLNKSANA